MVKYILRLFPKSIKNYLFSYIKLFLYEYNKKDSLQIPKFELANINIDRIKMVLDREKLLELLPKHAIIAELGVDEGEFSKKILSICNPKKLHLIDSWGSKRYNEDKYFSVKDLFKEEIDDKIVEINLGLSTEVVDSFENEYFDWVYIDTDHSYKMTFKELELYKTKIKDNGIIAGHDYIIGNWDGMVRYGVVEAVYEFCVKNNFEILYLSMEINDHPSFAIRKISAN